MGLTKNIRKRRKSGGKRRKYRNSRRFEKQRVFTKTKLASDKKIKIIRVRGGNYKKRLLRTNNGYFTWVSKGISKKTRILDVGYSSCNFEFIRTKTLVKGIVVLIDLTPFKRWYEKEFNKPLGKSKGDNIIPEEKLKDEQKKLFAKRIEEKKDSVDPELEKLVNKGKVLALITSRPGQCGEVQGRILEGPELHFYEKNLQRKRLLI